MPADGAYGLNSLIRLYPALSHAGWNFSFAPGVFAETLHLEERPGVSGFSLGPAVSLYAAKSPGEVDAGELRLSLAAGFLGPSMTWISTWKISAGYSVAIVKSGRENSVDLIAEAAFQRLETGRAEGVDVTTISTGVRIYE